MKTDQLIAAMAADTTARPRVAGRLNRGLVPAIALSVFSLVLLWGPRPELSGALASPALLKTLLPAALGACALWQVRRSAFPDSDVRPGWRALTGLGLVSLLFLAAALLSQGLSGLAAEMSRPTFLSCLLSVPVLSLPLLAVALWGLRAGAPLQPRLAGMAAGLFAGGVAAGIYSLHCTEDAALFYLPAYSAAILIVAAAGGAVGERLLRW